MNETTIKAMTSTGKDDWETPKDLFDELDAEFHFTLDPCCTHESAKCKKHYTLEDDGLAQDWGGRPSSAILRIPVGQKAILDKTHGCVNAGKNPRSQELRSSPFFRPERIQHVSTTTFWVRLRFVSSVAEFGS